jgi:antitoxin ParD1/3/4
LPYAFEERHMASMNISVPDPMREWVQRRIESGEYASVSDYVRDLIRRDQNAQTRRLSVEDIRRTIEEGRAAGGASPAEDVFARIEDKLRRLAG